MIRSGLTIDSSLKGWNRPRNCCHFRFFWFSCCQCITAPIRAEKQTLESDLLLLYGHIITMINVVFIIMIIVVVVGCGGSAGAGVILTITMLIEYNY
jgi:hypothetical protein